MKPLFDIAPAVVPRLVFDAQTTAHLELTPVTWDSPNGEQVLIRIDLKCPRCQHPLSISPNQSLTTFAEGFSHRQVLACPGHWLPSDDRGVVSAGAARKRCGWTAVFVRNQAHNPSCDSALMRPSRDPHPCNCKEDPNV